MIWLTIATAFAGYGDPVNGTPELAGRQVHLWTDAARVQPDAFEADYQAGGCAFAGFLADEQTPKAPLRHHQGLMEVAHLHNADMVDNNWFDHDSSDGTLWFDRVWPYYPGFAIGENINVGHSNPRSAVLSGWMCSPPHRGSIMNPDYEDFGGAWFDGYGTQDYGGLLGGAVPAVRTAMHEDQGATIAFYASYGHGSAPTAFEVVLDGSPVSLGLTWGADAQGVYSASVADPGAGCHEYYVRAEVDGTWVHFPETGSYGWGSCPWDDAGAQWMSGQLPAVAAEAPVLSSDPWIAGAQVTLTVDGATPGTTAHFVMGTAIGQGPCPGALGGLCFDVAGNTKKVGQGTADGNGVATMTMTVPAGASGRTVYLQAVADPGTGWAMSEIVTQSVP